KLSQAIDFMAARVAQVLEEARQAGQLDSAWDTRELAYFILASWQGALIRMKALKSPEPLNTFQRVIFERLLAP
ncbi:MAG: TetR family transcriptional regulator C-terminal domain-containing protein, partial [Pseudomonadota bacterium]